MPYFTDGEIEKQTRLFALVCLGGMAEGFDYSTEREKLRRWGKKRGELFYQGGYITEEELNYLNCNEGG